MVAQGTTFGQYELRELLGRGGMSLVYRAFDREQRRIVALKVLADSLSADAGFVERFRRESHATARLRDPHVLPVHRFGEIDGRLYIDMRLVDGRDLAQVLREDGPLDPGRAVHIVEQVAHALDAAHAEGIVHRDVKPSNVLVTATDFAYLADFGIAQAATVDAVATSLTSTGQLLGTLAYMAPERFSTTTPIDGRVDVYALACLLHEVLTGRRPFLSGDPLALMYAHLNSPPPAVSAQRPDLGAGWDPVVARGMAKHADRRYSHPTALAADARQVLHRNRSDPAGATPPGASGPGTATATRQPPPRRESGRPRPEHRTGRRFTGRAALAACGVVAALAAGVAAVVSNSGSPPEPDLGVSVPLSDPACDGRFVTIVGAAVRPETYAAAVGQFLERFPGASYLYGPAGCASIRARDSDGNGIYAVYYGPYPSAAEACAMRRRVGGDSYVRLLDDVTPPEHGVACS